MTDRDRVVAEIVPPQTGRSLFLPDAVCRFVYHRHAVDHEDEGMMGTVLDVA